MYSKHIKHCCLFLMLFTFTNLCLAQIDTTKSDMTFDLGWTRDKDVNLYPVIRYKTDTIEKSRQLDAVFSIYRFSENKSKLTRYSHFYPFYRINKTPQEKDFRLLSFYYPSIIRTNRDLVNDAFSFKFLELAPEINAMEFTKSANGLIVQNNLLFFLWYKNNQITKTSHLIFFPVFWSYTNPNKTTTTLFPLFSTGKYDSNSKKYLAITPLFWHFENENFSRNFLLPIFWNKNEKTPNDTIKTTTVFPLYFAYKNKDKNNKILFPLIWSYKNPYYKSFTFFPIFTKGNSPDNSESHLGLTPLFWHTKNQNTTRNVLFPLFWNKTQILRSGEIVKSNVLFPIYFSRKDSTINNKILFPIVWSFKNPYYKSFTFFPIFTKGNSPDNSESHFALTPLFWHTKNYNTTRNILFPIFWNKTQVVSSGNIVKSNVLFPIYFSHKDSTINKKILFPIIWSYKNPYYKSFTFFPIFTKGKSSDNSESHLGITPLFWHTKNYNTTRNILFPIFWNKKDITSYDTSYTNTIFPIYFSFKNSEKDNKIVFPVVWSFKNNDFKTLIFFPLFASNFNKDNSDGIIAITPLFWHIKNEDITRNILFPLIWNKTEKTYTREIQHSNVIFPIYFSYRDSTENKKIVFPIIWSIQNPTYRSVTFLPLFSFGKSKDLERKHIAVTAFYWHTKNYNTTRNVLFPFFWNKTKLNASGEIEKSNVLFPIYFSYKDSTVNNKVIFPIIWSFKNPNNRYFTIFPLFSSGKNIYNSEKYFAVTPLFWHTKSKNTTRNILFPIFWNKTRITYMGGVEKSNVLFPVYFSYKDSISNNKIVFPIFWSLRNSYYKSFTFFPIVSVGKSANNQESYFAITPLFWHTKNYNTTRNILFPIIWNKKEITSYDTIYRNRILPLYFSYRDKEMQNKIIFPVVWSYNNSEYKTLIFFPLMASQIKRDNSESLIAITPLFWHVKNKTLTRNVLFPILFTRKDSTTNNAVLFPIVWNFKTQYYKSLTVFPLFSVGKTSDNLEKYFAVSPLFWHTKTKYLSRNILFPLFWNKTRITYTGEVEKSNVLFPVYFSYKDSTVNNKIVFPIIWSLNNYSRKSFTIFPILSFGKSTDNYNKHAVVTPFFWFVKRGDKFSATLFPVFWYKKQSDSESSAVLFPIYWQKKHNETNNKILFPLVWNMKNNKYKSFTFIPVVSFGSSADNTSKHLAITPIFWHLKDSNSTKTVLFPLFDFKSNRIDEKNLGILYFLWRFRQKGQHKTIDFINPICKIEKDTNLVYFRFAPIIWYKKTSEKQFFSIQPFYYKFKTKEFANYNFLWQVFTYKNNFSQKKSWGFLWKTIYKDKFINGDHEFRILYMLYANVSKDGNIEKSFFPFYQVTKEKNGNKSFAIFFYCYNSFQKLLPSGDFYREEKIFWAIRLRSNYKKLKREGKI